MPRILVSGCPVGGATEKVIRAIEDNGGVVVTYENCNGAKSIDKLVDEENQVFVEIQEEEGGYTLKTNVYEHLGDFKAGIINSDILGCAFEPEERFENPDGTAIIFDRDYLGEHRGVSAMPGPFASARAAGRKIW